MSLHSADHGSQRLSRSKSPSRITPLLGIVLILALSLSGANATTTSSAPGSPSSHARPRVIPDSFRVSPEVVTTALADVATLKLDFLGGGQDFHEASAAVLERRDWVESILARVAAAATRPPNTDAADMKEHPVTAALDTQDPAQSIYTIIERGDVNSYSTGFGCGRFDSEGFWDDGCDCDTTTTGKKVGARASLEIDFQLSNVIPPGNDRGTRTLAALVAAVHNATDVSGEQLSWKFSPAQRRTVDQVLRRAAVAEVEALSRDFEEIFAAEGLRIARIEGWDEQRRGLLGYERPGYGWEAIRGATGVGRDGSIDEERFRPKELAAWMTVFCKLVPTVGSA